MGLNFFHLTEAASVALFQVPTLSCFVQAECKLLELLQRAVQYLRSPKISAAAALAFRPLLPQLLAQAFQTHCQSGTPASDWNAKTLICLAEVLVVTPYLHRCDLHVS